jgi:hypothetical protein
MKTFKNIIETFIFMLLISAICYGIYLVTGLQYLSQIKLTYLNWMGIVSLIVVLFPQHLPWYKSDKLENNDN